MYKRQFDGYALEAAARIKDKDPNTRIVVLSMGPEQAKAALKECLAIAADKAYLVSDRAFGGSDTLATSYIISETIKKVEELEGKFDAIFCGKQAIDGDKMCIRDRAMTCRCVMGLRWKTRSVWRVTKPRIIWRAAARSRKSGRRNCRVNKTTSLDLKGAYLCPDRLWRV